MNYYLWISGSEQGPYTIEQIRAAVADGTIEAQQTARTEDSGDWKPLSQIARLSDPKPAPPAAPTTSSANTKPSAAQPPRFQSSDLVGFFKFFAVLDFIAGGIGILMVFGGNASERVTGIILVASGIGGGFFLLGFAKIIECLHEMVFRLRNLERMTANSQSNPAP